MQNEHIIIHIITDKMKCKINLYIIDLVYDFLSYEISFCDNIFAKKDKTITTSLTKQLYAKFIINLYLLRYLMNFIKLYNYIIEKIININLL